MASTVAAWAIIDSYLAEEAFRAIGRDGRIGVGNWISFGHASCCLLSDF